MHNLEQNCLSYWYPRLVKSGVRTPYTCILETELDLIGLVEGDTVRGFGRFCERLVEAVQAVRGPPAFLRTGYGSGKHHWPRTCYLVDLDCIGRQVRELVEWSALSSIMGLPTNVWVLRELLPLKSVFRAFEGLPICVERRYFIRDGQVECHHPYWPAAALREAYHRTTLPGDWELCLCQANSESAEEVSYLAVQSTRVAAAMAGYWSLDWAQTVDGKWYAIDMALGENSWHPECGYASKENVV